MKRALTLLIALALTLSTQAIAFSETTESIYIVRGSEINLVARESSVPVPVTNELAGEVRVIVHLRSNSPRLQVIESQVQLVIPAGTTVNAQFPVKAIASGNVILVAWITSLNGDEIGKRVPLSMKANPDIEATAIVLFLGFVGVLLGTGIYRTVRRKRETAGQL